MMKRIFGFLIATYSYSSFAQQGQVFTLKQCMEVALANNLTMKQNQVSVSGSEVQLRQSQMSRYPSLNASASQSVNFGRSVNPYDNTVVADQRVNSNNMGLSASINLFNGFQIKNTVEQRQLNLQASKEDVNTTKNNIILGVVDAFANVLSSKALLASAKLQFESTQAQVDKTRRMVDAGRLPTFNLLDLKAQSATEETNIILAENSLDLAKLSLAQWMQIDVAQVEDVAEPSLIIPESEEVAASRIFSIAEPNQPQIKAAQNRLYSAEKGISIARSGFYPSLSLQAGVFTNYSSLAQQYIPGQTLANPLLVPINTFQVTGPDGEVIPVTINQIQTVGPGSFRDLGFSDQFNNNLRKGITLSLSIPLFNGFQSKYAVDNARLAQMGAKIQLEQQRNALRQTIETATTNERAARKRLLAVEKQISSLEEAFRMAEQRFNLGTMSAFDFIQTKNNLFRSKNDQARFKYDFFIRRALLDFYMGKELNFN